MQKSEAYNALVLKLQSTLLSKCRERGDAMRQFCQTLMATPNAEREAFVLKQWGQTILDCVSPILTQLRLLEEPPTQPLA